jgi:hypothetical protein
MIQDRVGPVATTRLPLVQVSQACERTIRLRRRRAQVRRPQWSTLRHGWGESRTGRRNSREHGWSRPYPFRAQSRRALRRQPLPSRRMSLGQAIGRSAIERSAIVVIYAAETEGQLVRDGLTHHVRTAREHTLDGPGMRCCRRMGSRPDRIAEARCRSRNIEDVFDATGEAIQRSRACGIDMKTRSWHESADGIIPTRKGWRDRRHHQSCRRLTTRCAAHFARACFGPIRSGSPRNSGSESSVTGPHTSGAKACIMALSSSSPCQRDTTSVASALPMVLVTARASFMKRSTPRSSASPATGSV